MKLATPFLVAATLICGASLAYAVDNNTGPTPGPDRSKERSTTGVGTNNLVPPPGKSYSATHQNFTREPTVRDDMRADQDDFPGVRR